VFLVHRGFIGGGYDGERCVRDEDDPVGRKKCEHEQNRETKQSRWGFRGMTLRNWLELLVVSLVLVDIGLLFIIQQAGGQQEMEQHQQELEERRAVTVRAHAFSKSAKEKIVAAGGNVEVLER